MAVLCLTWLGWRCWWPCTVENNCLLSNVVTQISWSSSWSPRLPFMELLCLLLIFVIRIVKKLWLQKWLDPCKQYFCWRNIKGKYLTCFSFFFPVYIFNVYIYLWVTSCFSVVPKRLIFFSLFLLTKHLSK